ncbi:hypothetical protein LZL87_012091 [Fusarium oxysporum]|nr:hypothetical protein LZL87_012091 [Fusarium oxysporum]
MGNFSRNLPKEQRASSACDLCRKRKSKCDEQKPCRLCRKRNLQCTYRRPILVFTDEALGNSQASARQLDDGFAAQKLIESQTISPLGAVAELSVEDECNFAPVFASAANSGYSDLNCPEPCYENPSSEPAKDYAMTNGKAKARPDIDVPLQDFSAFIKQPTWRDLHSEWPHVEKLICPYIKCHVRKPSDHVESSLGGFSSAGATATLGTGLDQLACPVEQGMPMSEDADQSIHSALVLMIMALGKICLRRDSAPSAVHLAESLSYDSLASHHGDISLSTRCYLPNEQNEKSRRSSTDGFCCGLGFEENAEETIGFGYFAYATNILRHHPETTDIKNVYVNIFAALYCGQLGRPKDSLAFIQKASGLLQVIIQPVLEKMRKLKQNGQLIQDIEHNQLALVFWTCLMLESDFKTELPSPGLLLYEDSMPHPNMRLLDGFSKRVCDGYLAQLFLRKQLNDIYQRLCTPELSADARPKKLGDLSEMPNAISKLHWVLPRFACEGNTRNDVLAARLRAKFWGAQVVIYRPFIQQILFSSDLRRNQV